MIVASASASPAQGVATAAIHGTVRATDTTSVEAAHVRVLHTLTGYVATTRVRSGRFFLQGLEVGGPYVIEVRQIGMLPQRSEAMFLTLGDPARVHFVLQPAAAELEPVQVRAKSLGGSGSGAVLVSGDLVHGLPTLNRNFLDFVLLAPQVSTKVGSQRSGVSAAGANLRFNNFLINGADERFVNGNISPSAQGKSLSLEAVKEFQVLVAPYDVRYGDFAGALVNTVTQSGTNELHGSTFAYWRNDHLSRASGAGIRQPYDRIQYGFSLGGPIIRDRVHFFIAPEFQHLSSPAPGPYLGQAGSAGPPVPIDPADLTRFNQIMGTYGLATGSAGQVEIRSPLENIFARIDASIARWNSRAMAFVNQAQAGNEVFARAPLDPTFHLSSYRYRNESTLRTSALRIHTDVSAAGAHNEFMVSHVRDRVEQLPDVRQPLVRVILPGSTGGAVTLSAGTAEAAQGQFSRSRAITIKDELSIPWGNRHMLLLGVQAERFRVQRGGVNGGYGVWTFNGLDALERGQADRYVLRRDLGGAGNPLTGGQYSMYAGSDWRATDRLAITLGVRGDIIRFDSRAPYNPIVDSIFARRTDVMPRARLELSPRVGFAWDADPAAGARLRGGLGIFTGRAPRAWILPAVRSHGLGAGVLQCGLRPGERPPPQFEPEWGQAPTSCASGGPIEPTRSGDVNLLDSGLRQARTLRSSVSYDRRLPWGIDATTEALFSRYLSDFIFVNLNLADPIAVDRFGRVLYGTLSLDGVPTPVRRSGFAEVIDLRNTSQNYSYQLSARAQRRLANGLAATAAYTFSRTRDVQSPSRVNMPGIRLWADARATGTYHDELQRGISLNDIPHRAVAGLVYNAPRRRWSTGAAFYYVGESGSPFTYVAGGVGDRGDLNADGSNINDPIYVPTNAALPVEIHFQQYTRQVPATAGTITDTVTVAQQAQAFERFIARTRCLRNQRGRILERNSCREPWSHTTIASVRQTIPLHNRTVTVELDAFNVLNLLHAGWGRHRVAAPQLLQHVGQTADPTGSSQPIFRFDPSRPEWVPLANESAFQLQAALRYRF